MTVLVVGEFVGPRHPSWGPLGGNVVNPCPFRPVTGLDNTDQRTARECRAWLVREGQRGLDAAFSRYFHAASTYTLTNAITLSKNRQRSYHFYH